MAWFDPDISQFFAELELDNSREWFAKNKARYEKSVKKPMEAFAGELIERMHAIDPAIQMQPKDAVFRIYRDVRFSKDKSPYKTNAGLSVSAGGKREHSRPGIYFHVDARSMGMASGLYSLEPNQIQALRSYLAANPDEFEACLADPEFVRVFGTIRGEKNKILPAEFKEAGERQPLIYNKQFYYWAEYPGEDITREDLADFVMSHFHAAQPMNEFLWPAIANH